MAAFVAAAGSFARCVAVTSSTCEPRTQISVSTIGTDCRHLSSSSCSSRTIFSPISPAFSENSSISSSSRRRCQKIISRAGGYRPPPGARRPKPNNNRQQSSDDGGRDGLPVNEEITASKVMLLGEDGKLIGTMSREEALYRAQELELDLVQLDKQDPPCVKIVDYSKLKYELQKRKKEQQKKNSASRMDVKELKMRYNIDVHDYGVRLRSAQRFLKDGDKVKIIVQFKGRELEFKDLGLKLFQRFEEDLKEEAMVESKITKDARSMSMVLAPNKTKLSTDKKSEAGDSADTVAAVNADA